LVQKHGARDTTTRGTAMKELEAMTPRFSQWLPGEEVPEKHWMYRLAKKYWFHDFGAYRDVAHDAAGKAGRLRDALNAKPMASALAKHAVETTPVDGRVSPVSTSFIP